MNINKELHKMLPDELIGLVKELFEEVRLLKKENSSFKVRLELSDAENKSFKIEIRSLKEENNSLKEKIGLLKADLARSKKSRPSQT